MLLTLKPQLLNRTPNDFAPGASSPSTRNIPSSVASTPRPAKISSQYTGRQEQPTPTSATHDHPADADHRSLLNPVTMALPAPDRGLPAISQVPTPLAHVPPSQWQNSEDYVRLWLQTKGEEERRKQEQERTQQESLKLDQRKIEQAMLRDSLQAGVPPYMIPFIFTGLGGGNLQWAQQYISQMSASTGQSPPQQIHTQSYSPSSRQPHQEYHQPQQPRPAPQTLPPQPLPQQKSIQGQHSTLEVPRDNRMIPPNPYAASRAIPAVARPAVQQTPPSPAMNSYHRVSPPRQSGSTPAVALTQPTAPLSRINSAEMHIQHSPAISSAQASARSSSRTSHPQHSASVKQESQQQAQSSPIYFHHWVPPSNPNTPSGKSPNISPNSGHPASHLRSEYQNSPRKRKAQGNHQPAPPPSSHLSDTGSTDPSPDRSHPSARRSIGHSRHRNDSVSQSNDATSTNQSELSRPGGQMNVNALVSNPDRTTSRSSHRDEPNATSSEPNQHGQIMILGRYRTNRNSRENSIATNASAPNESSGHRLEEHARKQSIGSQGGSNSNHISCTNGYHHPQEISNGAGLNG
ncbi:hypothetical protein PRK78_000371 [Emydomyces testavorans]|uniref:Uncharacterized protein n=1 Tax=Emydomyces testavorans TaxID=2070801 RepID=A0AAF0IHK8_9EURO|nr:hypothetical protein PRK78_000371 [Emydomyces testavorans]